MHARARVREGHATGRLIDAAILAGDESMPAVGRCLGVLPPDAREHEWARRLATASSRERQLALLRFFDTILTRQDRAEAA